MDRTALARRYAANNELIAELLGVFIAALRVEGAFATSDALNDESGVVVDQNCHDFPLIKDYL
jgi:hypothetical protein